MDILIFDDDLSQGGAARVTSVLCEGLVRMGHRVAIATNCVTKNVFYPIPKEIDIYPFYVQTGHKHFFHSILTNISYVLLSRKIINDVKPEIIIAVQPRPFFYAFLGNLLKKTPIIVCDHTSFSRNLDRLSNFIRFNLYAKADIVTILTERDKNILGNRLPNKRVVYNPVSFKQLSVKTERRNVIACAGRVDAWHIKGFDRIIEIWSSIANEFPDWSLEIAGDGSKLSFDFLQSEIIRWKVEKQVRLMGNISDIEEYLSHVSIFALPSRVEGFPMVLLEAMSQGCACLSFSIDGGVDEMMNNGESGIIVKDDDILAFACKLKEMIMHKEVRLKLSNNAISHSQNFSKTNFWNQWASLLQNTKRS